ncbi:n-acetylglutamate synthase [Echinicola soli]|uniref:N-acetylglutamate synthase n=1 Tax=Echinicola soli TaxID=2591634 RepID=A0A514CJY3_9BACT|nr:n-acetylglutamate synthase [Echinicola soli]QDH80133.1 n-acetylglutamate synthase [Echinicola soli]
MNYNNKSFKTVSNSDNGEVSGETIFDYKQEGNVLSGYYSGGGVTKGNLIGTVDEKGTIKMRYCHINTKGEIKTGKCISKPSQAANGKIRLHELWQWTSGDFSKGESIIEEV